MLKAFHYGNGGKFANQMQRKLQINKMFTNQLRLLPIFSKQETGQTGKQINLYKLPRSACSLSMASNKALKFPFPKLLAPFL